ncbi:unnamed protein product [Kluyveromyces dobzhanskii CBS 2104]|uniref:WGS project CCBQ000000000 data, contig MAT n=1 Tax=Kluyveromyces dobzhanskii CBS 2104 TaxID=1427455 RepID=A0A0A8L1A9_9SACH|nr:unnamed protein product [Kluyveromyces dobzhanskii CBS 2104]
MVSTTTLTFVPKPVQTRHQVHLVPCKVRYTGPTNEFEDQFIMDENTNDLSHENKHVSYIRGRKVIGESVIFKDSVSYITSSHEDEEGNLLIEPSHKVNDIFDYEREGNEDRLSEELSKFKELRELEALIHEA